MPMSAELKKMSHDLSIFRSSLGRGVSVQSFAV